MFIQKLIEMLTISICLRDFLSLAIEFFEKLYLGFLTLLIIKLTFVANFMANTTLTSFLTFFINTNNNFTDYIFN